MSRRTHQSRAIAMRKMLKQQKQIQKYQNIGMHMRFPFAGAIGVTCFAMHFWQ